MLEIIVSWNIVLVVEFGILIERSQIRLVEVAVDTSIPDLSTHRYSAVVVRQGNLPRLLELVPIRDLSGFMVYVILVVLGDDLVYRRRRSAAVVLAVLLLSVCERRYVRIVLARIAHQDQLDKLRIALL